MQALQFLGRQLLRRIGLELAGATPRPVERERTEFHRRRIVHLRGRRSRRHVDWTNRMRSINPHAAHRRCRCSNLLAFESIRQQATSRSWRAARPCHTATHPPTIREEAMNEDVLNMEIRKFLKRVGVTSQREIETAVRSGIESGKLKGRKSVSARMTLTIEPLGVTHEVTEEIAFE